MVAGDGERPTRSYIGWLESGGPQSAAATHKRFPLLHNLVTGAPIKVKLDEVGGHRSVVALDVRPGEPWDLLPPRAGVVTHVNTEKKLTHVALGVEDSCLVYHDRIPEAANWQPGTLVSIKAMAGRDRSHFRAVWGLVGGASSDSSFCRETHGPLKINKRGQFGFVDETYVPGTLISRAHAQDGDVVSVLGVASMNEKRKRVEWRAITVTLLESSDGGSRTDE